MLFPQHERPSFTPIQNKWQNYRFVYFNLYIPRQQVRRKEDNFTGLENSFQTSPLHNSQNKERKKLLPVPKTTVSHKEDTK
jgi:hypothetical protein